MMSKYPEISTDALDDPANLGQTLTALISSINLLRGDIERLKPFILKEVKAEIKSARDEANEAMKLASANDIAIKSLKDDMLQMQITCAHLVEENTQLRKQCEHSDNYSRKDNLIIRGIKETEGENEDSCVVVRKFFIEQLSLQKDVVDSMMFVRVHRLGQKSDKQIRPIIVRFEHYKDRTLVFEKRFSLKNSKYSLCEHFGGTMEYKRRKLYPILSAAKKSGNYEKKAYLNGDVLRINSRNYTVDDLDQLPADIHPKKLSQKTSADKLVFGGIHSDFNELSNYYKLKEAIVVKKYSYKTIEHGFQHIKAMHFKDYPCALRILGCTSPADAKKHGNDVKNFDVNTWNRLKKEVMLELLRKKFARTTELADVLVGTGDKTLVEAGMSRSFAIGIPLHSPQIFNETAWKGDNLLGKCLVQIRNELTN